MCSFFLFERVISDCNHTNQRLESAQTPRATSSRAPRDAHPGRAGDLSKKQQLPFRAAAVLVKTDCCCPPVTHGYQEVDASSSELVCSYEPN